MLLAKPKKDYKSVSKTELMKETLEEAEKEANPSEEAFNIYDEFQEVCEKVSDNEWPAINGSIEEMKCYQVNFSGF